ncbi:MAG TPA: hypothetical protein VFK73_05070 [Paludibacter sp.]|nr:hypothetical protein [Paludibacter sp.]
MKRSFSVFILFAFFVCSIFSASRTTVEIGKSPMPPFPRIISVSLQNQALPLASVTISETK